MSGKLRAQPKMATRKGGKDPRAKVIMLKDRAVSRKFPAQSKIALGEINSARPEHLLVLEQAHREELERVRLQYVERIRQAEAARLNAEHRLDEQLSSHANLAEQYSLEAKQRTVELLSAKDLLLKATEDAVTVEKRILDTESRSDAFDTERRTLQETILKLRGQQEDQAKETALVQAQLQTERQTLEAVTQQYRGAAKQVTVLEQRVMEEAMARQAAEQVLAQATNQLEETQRDLLEVRAALLQQQLTQLTVEEQAKRVAVHEAEGRALRLEAELETATQQYRGAGEQVIALKQRVMEEEIARQAVEQALAQAALQLEQAQFSLQEERAAFQQQLVLVTAEGQAKSVAVQEADGKLLRVETKLAETNQKYQAATEQLTVLQKWLTQEETARQAAEQALAQATLQLEHSQQSLQEERATLQQLTQLTSEEQAKRIAVHEAALETATQQNRGVTEQVATLQQWLTQEETARQAAEQALAQATRQLQQSQWSLQEERAALQHQLTQLAAEEQAKRVAVHEMGGKLLRLKAELEAANQQNLGVGEQVNELKQRVTQAETARQVTEEALTKTTTWLEQAKSRNRQLTTETIPELKNKLETQYSTVRDGRHALEQVRIELRESKKSLAETTKQLQKARQQIEAAGHQLEKTRATSISFRLGYLLIHNSKSAKGLLRLPSALWALRKETLQRRKKKVFVPSPPHLSPVSKPAYIVSRPAALTDSLPQEQSSHGRMISADAPSLFPAESTSASAPDRKLNIACILNEITFSSFHSEATLHRLTPSHWRAELEAAKPDLLFIESAEYGKDGLWCNAIGQTSAELPAIVEWCRAKQVPTVLWCKEDPIHSETFLNIAKLFDYLFTPDIDSISRYKGALGHDRVYLLPFACQPATNNPIETYQRKDAFCFMGAFHVRYPERTRELSAFVLELPAFRPLEIYDCNYGKNDPGSQFPAEYRQYIVGTLPFDQIDRAHKGYRYAINLNLIKQSQSMFDRRVFELLASNTVTISNFSRGLRLLFGDLVISTDSGAEVIRRLKKLTDNEPRSRKFRLAGLRKMMSEHTYGQRLAYVVSKVSGKVIKQSLPHIAVLAHVENQRELDGIQANYQRQRYAHSLLYVIVGEGMVPPVSDDPRVRLLTCEQAKKMVVDGIDKKAELVAGMVAADYYGPNYLEDIALATRYTSVELIGKAARYTWEGGGFQLKQPDDAYHHVRSLPARAAAIRRQAIAHEPILSWVQSLGTRQLQADQGLAIDEFNYCEQGAAADVALIIETVDDLLGLNTGIAIDDLLEIAERIAPERACHDESPRLTGSQLAGDFGKRPSAAITLAVEGQSWRVDSTLPDGKHDYFYATTDHSLDELGFTERLKFYFDVTSGLDIQLVIVFLDVQQQKISQVIKPANHNVETVIPPGTTRIRLGLRIYSGGNAVINGLVLGHRNLQPSELIGEAEHLLLTNQYPSYDDLYRNAFVHSRVVAYAERGIRVDVFRLRSCEGLSYHEFHNIDVITGSQEALHKLLTGGHYQSVLVHFLDEAMWQVLQHHIGRVKVFVWAHGFEIQPWHRRDNFENEEQRDKAKVQSKARMAFWRNLLRQMPENLHLIFVSKYLAEVTMEDLGFRLPDSQYRVIHNAIDTDLFAYQRKSAEQRKKILSIRPYTSRTYANDLSVKAILLLSEKPYFKDLEFRIIGNGRLFDEVLAPVREFGNVYIEKRFLTHAEIAAMHREYGIFLCPSRMDTQGVSRDEAMSSGLVPVTNAVAAIPEFVDGICGCLAPPEDSAGLAEGIARLYESPELFLAMSAAAAERVRLESGRTSTIGLELSLFTINHI